jgi:hypothetical protein
MGTSDARIATHQLRVGVGIQKHLHRHRSGSIHYDHPRQQRRGSRRAADVDGAPVQGRRRVTREDIRGQVNNLADVISKPDNPLLAGLAGGASAIVLDIKVENHTDRRSNLPRSVGAPPSARSSVQAAM